MDAADRAQVELEREQERQVANALARAARVVQARETCLHCAEPLEGIRREYGLCVPCAEQRERLDALMGIRR